MENTPLTLALAPAPLLLSFLPPNDSLSLNEFDRKNNNSPVFSSVFSVVIPLSNELFNRREDPEQEDKECTNGYTISVAAIALGLPEDWNGFEYVPLQLWKADEVCEGDSEKKNKDRKI